MVLLGGLELLAAGYVIREYNKSKTEQRALEAEDASSSRRHRHHSHDRHTRSHSYDDRDRKHRRHRSESRDRRDSSRERRYRRDKEEYQPAAEPVYRPDPRDRRGRVPVAAAAMQNLVPPQPGPGYPAGPGRVNSAPPPQMRPPPTQQQQNGFPPTGWPPNWAQAHTPPPNHVNSFPPPQQQYQGPPLQNMQRAPTMPPPQPIPQQQQGGQRPMGPNGYPQDVKYGFDPRIPHDLMPAPPPYSGPSSSTPNLSQNQSLVVPGQGSDGGRRRRRRSGSERRSVSPNLGLYDEDEERRQAEPRVRFSMEEEVLGEDERRNRRREARRERRGRGESPPPAYGA